MSTVKPEEKKKEKAASLDQTAERDDKDKLLRLTLEKLVKGPIAKGVPLPSPTPSSPPPPVTPLPIIRAASAPPVSQWPKEANSQDLIPPKPGG